MNLPPRVSCDADPASMTIEQAMQRIKDQLPRFQRTEQIACRDALDRICSADIISPRSVPSFRASAMDGYAVRTSECSTALQIAGQSLAGHPGADLIAPFTCQRITTGARVPDQADAVVQQENVILHDDKVEVIVAPTVGLNIRQPGSDSAQGRVLISGNSRLGVSEIALLASHGISRVEVFKPLTIGLFSTGDELVNPEQEPGAGQIFDANRPLLRAMLSSAATHVVDLGICTDSITAIEQTFASAESADLLISSGGVSVGDADHVRTVLQQRGKVDLWKIAMKPGRPLTFGFSSDAQAYFGLPGNPVSAAITCLLFVKPAISHMLGLSYQLPPPLQLPLQGNLTKLPGRVEFQRAIMQVDAEGLWHVSTTGLQDSHVLTSLHKANCLIELETDSAGATHGEYVKVYPFTHYANGAL